MENTCDKCLWFGSAIYCCFHPDNEGRRAFPNMKACDVFRNRENNPLTEEEENNFRKMLFGDDNKDNSMQ